MTEPLPESSPLRASALALSNVFDAFFEQANGDQALLDTLFAPILAREAQQLGVPPEVLMAEINTVLFGEDTVLNAPDE